MAEATTSHEGSLPVSGPVGGQDAIASRFNSLLEPADDSGLADEQHNPEPADSLDDEETAEEPVEASEEDVDDAGDAEDSDESEEDSDGAESPDTLEDIARVLGAKDDAEVEQYTDLLRNQLRVPVKINGETKRVTLREALDGYSRSEDYRANNQTLLEERRRFDEASQQAATQWKARFDKANEVVQVLESEMASEDLDAILANEGAEAYIAAKSRQDRRQQAIDVARAEAAQANEYAQQQAAEKYQAFLAEQRKVMVMDFPDVEHPEKGPKLTERWKGYLKDREFSEQEIAQLADARIIRVIDDAMRYRDLKKAQPERVKKVKSLPKVMKPGKGEAPKPKSKADIARNKLRRSGKVNDAADVITALFS